MQAVWKSFQKYIKCGDISILACNDVALSDQGDWVVNSFMFKTAEFWQYWQIGDRYLMGKHSKLPKLLY